MKKISFNNSRKSSRRVPFYQPWGFWQYFWRFLVFLLLLAVLLFLLSLIKQCHHTPTEETSDLPAEFRPDPGRTSDSKGEFPIDTIGPDMPFIDDPNLPSPPNNRLRPVDPDEIATDDDGIRKVVNNRLNVILNSDADDATFKRWASEFKSIYPDANYQVVFYDNLTKLIQIQVPVDRRTRVLHDLPNQITDIDFKIFAEEIMSSALSGKDPVFNHKDLCWYFEPIQTYQAWNITQGSPDVVIAIVDSYFDLNHDDINSERIFKPYSVIRRTGNVAPEESCDETAFMHGSMVLSIAAGNINNGKGSAGIAPQCRVMPISLGTSLTSMGVLQGILYAIYQGASVVNISIGNSFDDAVHSMSVEDQVAASKTIGLDAEDVWTYVYKLAEERNVTLVWAAGNEDLFTALDASKRNQTTIRVSAVDTKLHKADFSNFGNIPSLRANESTVSAPGVRIMGAKPYNNYEVSDGTSFAAPIVTGAVALIKSLDPTLSNSEIVDILRSTGKPIEGCTTIGPLIQIKDALLKVKDNFARMDDITINKNNFLGLWQSVELQPVMNLEDGVWVRTSDFVQVYFNITSLSSGTLIVNEATTTKCDFTAPLSIKWNKEAIKINQLEPAKNPTRTNVYIKNIFSIIADSEGLMLCTAVSGSDTSSFYLKKIKSRTDK